MTGREATPRQGDPLFCVLDGQACHLTLPDSDDDTLIRAECPAGHAWQITVEEEAPTPDGWAVFGFQCDNNNETYQEGDRCEGTGEQP